MALELLLLLYPPNRRAAFSALQLRCSRLRRRARRHRCALASSRARISWWLSRLGGRIWRKLVSTRSPSRVKSVVRYADSFQQRLRTHLVSNRPIHWSSSPLACMHWFLQRHYHGVHRRYGCTWVSVLHRMYEMRVHKCNTSEISCIAHLQVLEIVKVCQ